MKNAESGFTQAYAFTVTLKPVLFKDIAEQQYDKTQEVLVNTLRNFALGRSYTIVAEMTKNCNIHYHGILKCPLNKYKNVIKSFKDTFRHSKVFGFVDIKVMDDEDGWIEYITKELRTTHYELNRHPKIFDGLSVIPEL